MSRQSPLERIQSYTTALIDWFCASGRPDLASSQLAQCDELVMPLREAIAHGCRCGYVLSPDPDRDAQAILHLVLGVLVTHITIERPAAREELELAVMRTIRGALGIQTTTATGQEQ